MSNNPLRRHQHRRDIKRRKIRRRPHAHRPPVHQGVQGGNRTNSPRHRDCDHGSRAPRARANFLYVVPDVTLDSLASTSKMRNAGYFSIFDEEEVRIYDARTTKVLTSKPPVFKRWRDKVSTL